MSAGLLDRASRLPLRLVMHALQALRRVPWVVSRPQVRGAHAVALTPAGKIVLVRLRYASGWRLPGGGIEAGEDAADAVVRELREEIGMTSHGSVRLALADEVRIDFRRDHSSVFIVTDVTYAPRWSWEVEAIGEWDIKALPQDLSPRVRRWLSEMI